MAVDQAPAAVGSGEPVAAALAGTVFKVLVSVGDSVSEGQPVLVVEAMKMEHTLSADEADALAARLGHPAWDPHGDPIPAADGTMSHEDLIPMASLEPGQLGVLRRMKDEIASGAEGPARELKIGVTGCIAQQRGERPPPGVLMGHARVRVMVAAYGRWPAA